MSSTLIPLGILAATAVVQCAVLVGLAAEWRLFAARLDRLERELSLRLARLGDLVENAAALSDAAVRQVPRVEAGLARLDRTAAAFETFVLRPLRPAAAALALWRSLKRGASVYRRLGH